jgi:hypothetical protein
MLSGADRACERPHRRHRRTQAPPSLSRHELARRGVARERAGAHWCRAQPKTSSRRSCLRADPISSASSPLCSWTPRCSTLRVAVATRSERRAKARTSHLNQMVLGIIMDQKGRPVCSEMWPGNTADVTTLLAVIDRLRQRFAIGRVCVVADRGMISDATIAGLRSASSSTSWACVSAIPRRSTTSSSTIPSPLCRSSSPVSAAIPSWKRRTCGSASAVMWSAAT